MVPLSRTGGQGTPDPLRTGVDTVDPSLPVPHRSHEVLRGGGNGKTLLQWGFRRAGPHLRHTFVLDRVKKHRVWCEDLESQCERTPVHPRPTWPRVEDVGFDAPTVDVSFPRLFKALFLWPRKASGPKGFEVLVHGGDDTERPRGTPDVLRPTVALEVPTGRGRREGPRGPSGQLLLDQHPPTEQRVPRVGPPEEEQVDVHLLPQLRDVHPCPETGRPVPLGVEVVDTPSPTHSSRGEDNTGGRATGSGGRGRTPSEVSEYGVLVPPLLLVGAGASECRVGSAGPGSRRSPLPAGVLSGAPPLARG